MTAKANEKVGGVHRDVMSAIECAGHQRAIVSL